MRELGKVVLLLIEALAQAKIVEMGEIRREGRGKLKDFFTGTNWMCHFASYMAYNISHLTNYGQLI